MVRGLALVLQHPSPLVRRTAVDGLARIRTPEAMQPLVPVLLSDANGDVRAAAMRAMRECPDPAWRPLLAAKGDDPLVREVLRAIDTKQPPPGGCL